jgi:hypothetical protein
MVVQNQEWKGMRNVITPTFSAAKLKAVIFKTNFLRVLVLKFQITPTIDKCGIALATSFGNAINSMAEVIELKQ